MLLYREAVAADLQDICVLGEDVNVLHHEAWPHIFAARGDPARHAPHWLKNIQSDKATTYVAQASQRLVGFVTVGIVEDHHSLIQPDPYGRVGSLCVAADHRGQGIGRELMTRAENWVHQQGVGDVRLNVWAFNDAALRLYRELGYEIRSHQLGKRRDRAAAAKANAGKHSR